MQTFTEHQRKLEFVKRCGRFSRCLWWWVVAWGFLLRMMPVSAGWCRHAVVGACAGMLEVRGGMMAVPRGYGDETPVTWVFSLYVVQAGSACLRVGGQACSYSVQPGW